MKELIEKYKKQLAELQEAIDGEITEFTMEWIGSRDTLTGVIKDIETYVLRTTEDPNRESGRG